MSFLDSLKKALKPETFAALIDEAGEDFDFSVVPYSRFQKVIGERNTLRDQLAEAGAATGNPDPDKKFTQKDIDDAVTKAVTAKETELKASFDTDMNNYRLRDASLAKLRDANAVDAELLYDSPKFDKTKIKFDDKGELEGLDDVIKAWQKSHPTLFDDGVPNGTGRNGGKHEEGTEQAVNNALNGIFGLTPDITAVQK